jgi:hypothetical protein
MNSTNFILVRKDGQIIAQSSDQADLNKILHWLIVEHKATPRDYKLFEVHRTIRYDHQEVPFFLGSTTEAGDQVTNDA